jgi:phosphoenolpyruvate carboxykinase (ATP)
VLFRSGGAYGVGKRFPIAVTRKLLTAALTGEMSKTQLLLDPNFGFAVPEAIQGIEEKYLHPRKGWADTAAYDVAAQKLVGLFTENFK